LPSFLPHRAIAPRALGGRRRQRLRLAQGVVDSASPKKVQSLSAWQPNEVRSAEAAVMIAVSGCRGTARNTPE
jgi:hypothetical protein